MSIYWTNTLDNEIIYHPVVDEDEYVFHIAPSHRTCDSRQRHFLMKNEHHLERVIGIVED